MIATIVAAYLLVVQAAIGGFDSARHGVLAAADPLGVICLTLDAQAAGHGDDAGHRGACCTLGCLSIAAAPLATPDAVAFAYEPASEVRRSEPPSERLVSPQADRRLKPPRAPPAEA